MTRPDDNKLPHVVRAENPIARFAEEQPEELRAAWRDLAAIVEVFAGVETIIGSFAAPRLLAEADMSKTVPREKMLDLFDRYLAVLEKDRLSGACGEEGKLDSIEEPTRRIRVLLEKWEFAPVAPPFLIRAARDWMSVRGIDMTDDEWNEFVLEQKAATSIPPREPNETA